MPSADGLYVTLGSGDDLDEALMARMEAATSAPAAPAAAPTTEVAEAQDDADQVEALALSDDESEEDFLALVGEGDAA